MFNLTIFNFYIFEHCCNTFFSNCYFSLLTNVLLFQEIVMSIAWQIKAIHYFFEKTYWQYLYITKKGIAIQYWQYKYYITLRPWVRMRNIENRFPERKNVLMSQDIFFSFASPLSFSINLFEFVKTLP